jgi:hypothetical protein
MPLKRIMLEIFTFVYDSHNRNFKLGHPRCQQWKSTKLTSKPTTCPTHRKPLPSVLISYTGRFGARFSTSKASRSICASSEHGPTCVLRFEPFACRSQMGQSITKAVAWAVVASDPIKSVFHLFWFVGLYSLSYACHIVKAPNPCRQQMHDELILNRGEPHRSR